MGQFGPSAATGPVIVALTAVVAAATGAVVEAETRESSTLPNNLPVILSHNRDGGTRTPTAGPPPRSHCPTVAPIEERVNQKSDGAGEKYVERDSRVTKSGTTRKAKH